MSNANRSNLIKKIYRSVNGFRQLQLKIRALYWSGTVMSHISAKMVGKVTDDETSRSLIEFEMDDGDKIIQQINLEYSGLYAKASSLLTHVSLMIAALSFIFGAENGIVFRAMVLINIISYLVALLFILRVIWVPNFQETDLQRRRTLLSRELILSQRYLRIAHRLAVSLTVFVIVLLIVHIGTLA